MSHSQFFKTNLNQTVVSGWDGNPVRVISSGGYGINIGTGGNVSIGIENNDTALLVSGDLSVTGNLYLSGTNVYSLFSTQQQLALTGQQAWNAANSNGINLSGNLTQTGITLNTKVNSLSGFTTGMSGALYTLISQSAGGVASLNSQSGILTLQGTGTVTVVSGGVGLILVSGTAVNLNGYITTGDADARYYPLNSNPSGYITTGNTGQFYPSSNPQQYATSGNLQSTGQTLQQKIDSLSGFTTGISGYLQSQIGPSTIANVVYTTGDQNINGLKKFNSGFFSGNIVIGDISNANVAHISGYHVLEIFANEYPVIALNRTGKRYIEIFGDTTEVAYLTSAGNIPIQLGTQGQAELRIMTNYTDRVVIPNGTVTGLYVFDSIRTDRAFLSGGTNIADIFATKGQLTTTGVTLRDLTIGGDTNLSGTIRTTGSNLYVLVTGMSGQANTNYATQVNLTTTGQTLQGRINSLSGFVGNVSGGLEVRIAQTGNAAILYANEIGTNLSGNLTTTGTLLSAVKITGSNIINVANFTGLGGTLIFSSGNSIFISGSAGGAGGGVTSLNGLTDGVTIAGKGSVSVSVNGQNILVSGDETISGVVAQTGAAAIAYANSIGVNLSGDLTLTGQTLQTRINSLSGFAVNIISGGLETRISQTGNAAILYANSIGENLSGNLVITGTLLSAVRITGSNTINSVNLTGLDGAIVFVSGNYVVISGSQGGGPGGGVSSLNGLTDTIILAGSNIDVSVNSQTINLSGKYSQLVHISGDQTIYNVKKFVGSGVFGTGDITVLPYCPLEIVQSGNAYIQVNLENNATGLNASSDYIVTASDGSDTQYYLDLGLNNPGYNQNEYSMGTGHDGYLMVNGGDLHFSTLTTGYDIGFYVEGAQSGNLSATVIKSGINVPSGKYFSVNNYPITSFSRGGGFYNLDGISSGINFAPVWYAPYPCRATGVRGYIVSGTSATVNAYRNTQGTNLLVSDLNVTTPVTWATSGLIQAANIMFNPGDTLGIQLTQNVNNPVSVLIQVDFIRT